MIWDAKITGKRLANVIELLKAQEESGVFGKQGKETFLNVSKRFAVRSAADPYV